MSGLEMDAPTPCPVCDEIVEFDEMMPHPATAPGMRGVLICRAGRRAILQELDDSEG